MLLWLALLQQIGSLNIDDFRASEKTFQILTQVAGRAGRGEKSGQVIVQTYNPDNFSIQCAKEQDYDMFYESEIILRKRLRYPPFSDIIAFNITSADEENIKKAAFKIYNILLKNSGNKLEIYKPMPSPISKIKNKYRWRIIAKCKFNNSVIDIINKSLDDYYKIKTLKASITVDVNPTNMS